MNYLFGVGTDAKLLHYQTVFRRFSKIYLRSHRNNAQNLENVNKKYIGPLNMGTDFGC